MFEINLMKVVTRDERTRLRSSDMSSYPSPCPSLLRTHDFLDYGHGLGHGQSHDFKHGHGFGHAYVRNSVIGLDSDMRLRSSLVVTPKLSFLLSKPNKYEKILYVYMDQEHLFPLLNWNSTDGLLKRRKLLFFQLFFERIANFYIFPTDKFLSVSLFSLYHLKWLKRSFRTIIYYYVGSRDCCRCEIVVFSIFRPFLDLNFMWLEALFGRDFELLKIRELPCLFPSSHKKSAFSRDLKMLFSQNFRENLITRKCTAVDKMVPFS